MSCIQQASQTTDAATGTTLFEVGVRSRCSRVQSSRGRPQQCARTAARTSSSRSSTRSRRPSAEVDLRCDIQAAQESTVVETVETPTFTVCASTFVGGLITCAVDDIVTELDYYTDEECPASPSSSSSPKKMLKVVRAADCVLNASEPAITEEETEEEDEEEEDVRKLQELAHDGLECSEGDDGNDDCDFDDDVCSLASDVCEVDALMATQVARSAVSDDTIERAFTMEPVAQKAVPVTTCLDCDSLCDEDEEVDFLGEAPAYGDELAFNFASSILDGAFQQAATTWEKKEELTVADSKPVEKSINLDMEVLKQRARTSLLKAFKVETASPTEETDQLKNKVQKALVAGVESGGLHKALSQIMPPKSEKKTNEDTWQNLRDKVQEKLLSAKKTGMLSQVMRKTDPWQNLRNKVQEGLKQSVANGKLQETVEAAMPSPLPAVEMATPTEEAEKLKNKEQKDVWQNLRRKVQQNLLLAQKSGMLNRALGQVMRKTDPWENLRNKVQEGLKQSVANGKLRELVEVAMPSFLPADAAAQAATPSTSRSSMRSCRSRRRIIGGVVRSPASIEQKMKQPPPAIRLDLSEVEPACEEESSLVRASSLTRTYDMLGVQLYNLAALDSPLMSSARKLSKTRSRLQEASASAMDMDLSELQRPGPKVTTTEPRQMFAAKQLNSSNKMRPSASLGSLTSSKVRVSGGLLPILAPEKTCAESIAWTMQVSKTASKWSNTGLRGSKSMIF